MKLTMDQEHNSAVECLQSLGRHWPVGVEIIRLGFVCCMSIKDRH